MHYLIVILARTLWVRSVMFSIVLTGRWRSEWCNNNQLDTKNCCEQNSAHGGLFPTSSVLQQPFEHSPQPFLELHSSLKLHGRWVKWEGRNCESQEGSLWELLVVHLMERASWIQPNRLPKATLWSTGSKIRNRISWFIACGANATQHFILYDCS